MPVRFSILLLWFIIFSGILFLSSSLTPDSYAYVNGAINLVKHGTYSYCCNMFPVSQFAPNYSLFLMPFIAIGGATGIAIIMANVLLYAFTLYLLFNKSFTRLKNVQFLFVSLVISMITYRYHAQVLSENIFIPLFLSWFALRFTNTRFKGYSLLLLIALLEVLLIGTKYSYALLLVSYYATEFLLLFIKGSWVDNLRKKITVFLFALIPIGYYVLQKKIVVGETGREHVISLGGGKYTFYEYAYQLFTDIQRFVFGDVFAFLTEQYHVSWLFAIALFALLFYYVDFKLNTKRLVFLVVSFVVHLIVLSNLWIADGFSGRLAFWLYVILFFRNNIKLKDFSNKVRYWSFRLFLASVIVINLGSIAYKFQKQQSDKAYQLRYNYTFSDEPVYSSEAFNPELVEENGELYLKNPCYPWAVDSTSNIH